MVSKKIILTLFFSWFLTSFLFYMPTAIVAGQELSIPNFNFLPVVERADQDFEQVKELIQTFENFGPRYTSSPGCKKARDFILNWFNQYLENVTSQAYNLTVLVDYGGNLTLEDGTNFEVHPLMPNVVVPVNVENLTGPLIYVGNGELKDFDYYAGQFRKPIKGSIVLMDFNSGFNWLNAAKLGAKAVIFLEPSMTNREQAMQKQLDMVPYDYPRFYLKREDASQLLKALHPSPNVWVSVEVSLSGKTRWEMREAENIMGFVKGTKYPEDWIILSAYYDSLSVVPSMSKGASEAVSISILLSLAKYYSENPPEYTIMFVAFSGHNQGIWGAREWVEKYLFGPDHSPNSSYYWEKTIAEHVVGAFDINIIPDTPLLYTVPEGGFYITPELLTMASDSIILLIESYNLLMEQTGKDYGLLPIGTGCERSITESIKETTCFIFQSPNYARWFDLEALFVAGQPAPPGYHFATGRALDLFYYTPIDTYETIEPLLLNVKSQMEILYTWLHTFLHTDYLHIRYSYTIPENKGKHWGVFCEIGSEGLHSNHQCFATDKVHVVTYNTTTGWYSPVKPSSDRQVLVVVNPDSLGDYDWIQYRNRILIVALADEEGVAKIIGRIGREGMSRTWNDYDAFVLNRDGKLTHVRDFGQYALPQEVSWVSGSIACRAKTVEEDIHVVVFECGGFMIFDYIDPNYLDLSYLPFTITARYHIGHTTLIHHNLAVAQSSQMYYDMGHSFAMAFVEPNVPVELTIYSPHVRTTLGVKPYSVFINATAENPEGYGYTIKPGVQVPITIFDYARDLYYINEERIKIAEAARMSGIYTTLHNETAKLLNEMEEALKNYQYSKAYVKAVDAWRSEIQAYSSLRETLEGAIITVPFFCMLIIPFAFLSERLFFHFGGYRRLAAIIGVFLAVVALFSAMHPGFVLASSILIVLVSFAIIALITPAVVVVVGQANTMLATIRRKAVGVHFIEIGKMSFATSALSTGIENMRKRRFRTVLTLISIILLSFALVLFTSVAGIQFTKVAELPVKYVPPYEGLVMQREYFGHLSQFRYGIGVRALEYLQAKYGDEAIIAPRVWIWPLHGGWGAVDTAGYLIVGPNYPDNKPVVVRALLALTPQEAQLTNVEAALLGNNSRWFTNEDLYACILPKPVAANLGIQIDLSSEPVKVNIDGLSLTVIGIIDPEILDAIVDINGVPLTPLDFRYTGIPPLQLFSSEIIIIPAKLAPSLISHWVGVNAKSSMISSVAIKFQNVNLTLNKSMEIFHSFMGSTIQVWSYHSGRLYMLTVARSVKSTGMTEQIVALILVGLTIFNLMLGSVQERRRDIFIYSSVGLSPIHVSLMFLAEAVVYAIIGSLIGYVAAMIAGKLTLIMGVKLGFMNYASEWVAGAIGAALLATIISTIYPMIVASKIVTPSLERRWRIPTKPVGDEWTIPLPFFPTDENEARGILEFVKEYFEHHMSPIAPDFSVSTINLFKTEIEGFPAYVLESETRIIPYELGIRQMTRIQAINKAGRWNILVHLTRLAGATKAWTDHNRDFLSLIRRQFLIWRGLPEVEKAKYIKAEGE